MNKEINIDSKEAKDIIETCFKQNLRMENSIFRIMIDILLRYCPNMTFQSCYNTAIIQMTEKDK